MFFYQPHKGFRRVPFTLPLFQHYSRTEPKNKNKKESILYFFIPHIIFIILVTITDNFEIAVALSAQAIASSTMLGFLLSLVLRKYKKYAYLIGSIVALLYPMMN